MAYIGNKADAAFTSLLKQDLTGASGQTLTLSHAIANENDIALYINNVRQEPISAYTVSNVTVNLTGTVSGTDDIYVIYLARAIQTTVPPDGSVSTAKIANSAVDLTSKVTGVLPVSNSQTNTPAFEAYVPSTVENLTDNTAVKMPVSTEVFDSDGKYDNSNYRFTPTIAGKYFVYASAIPRSESNFDILVQELFIYKNGSEYRWTTMRPTNANNGNENSLHIQAIMDLDTSDYVEIYANCNTTSNAQWKFQERNKSNYFGAYKLIGV